MNLKSIENKTGPFVHTVFFWLKNPTHTSDRKAFEKAIRKLIETNPQAISNHLGCPAESEKREVVDNSFTYCYVMIFPDEASQNAYQTDSTHLKFIEEASHLWDRVLVYDSLSINN
jgi:hypothetical protein